MSTSDFSLDLTDPATFAAGHPWEAYRWLREHAPVWWHAGTERARGTWVLSRHDDIRSASRRPDQFSSYEQGVMLEDLEDEVLGGQRNMMLNMDPPQHDRFKLLVNRGFTPRNAAELRPRIQELATSIIDDVVAGGSRECDFVADIAGRLPSGLIAELMGIPPADGERLYELTEIMHTTDPAVAPLDVKVAAVGEMLAHGAEVANDKRGCPADDIASTLVAAEVDGQRLSDDELSWFFLLLVNAGGDTTRNLLAAGMRLLIEHPDERRRLADDLDTLLPTAVDEMLRYTSPVIYFRRTLTSPTVVRDVEMAAGDKVTFLYGSANRDADVFDDPDRFDVGRTPNPHLAFGGGGPHLCLGMHVARIETEVMLREILTRLPDLQPNGEPELMHSNFIAGVHTMPVRF